MKPYYRSTIPELKVRADALLDTIGPVHAAAVAEARRIYEHEDDTLAQRHVVRHRLKRFLDDSPEFAREGLKAFCLICDDSNNPPSSDTRLSVEVTIQLNVSSGVLMSRDYQEPT